MQRKGMNFKVRHSLCMENRHDLLVQACKGDNPKSRYFGLVLDQVLNVL